MRAILWAVAVIACLPPLRALIRRENAPKADLLRDSVAAAIRKAWAARLGLRFTLRDKTLPPEILVPGHKLSQELKCLTVFQGLRSNPTSLLSTNKVSAARPGMAKRSTPLFWKSRSLTLTPPRCRSLAEVRFCSGGGGLLVTSGCVETLVTISSSQSSILVL